MRLTTLVTLVTPAVIALIAIATIADAQLPVSGPPVRGPIDGLGGGRGAIRPCSSLLGPGSCSPGPSIDVTRYIPPPNTAASGGLRLQIRPASAAVYVDGRYAGRVNEFDGNSERLVLTPGSHSVIVRAPGYEPLEIETRTHAGETRIYRGTLSRSARHD
jgi:PEGA domain